MPCNSDYLGPTDLELKLSHVRGLLDEVETGALPDGFGPGYIDDSIYHLSNRTLKKELDKATAELCSSLKELEAMGGIHAYSLELQLWWRDHKLADAARLEAKEREDLARELKSLKGQQKKTARRIIELEDLINSPLAKKVNKP